MVNENLKPIIENKKPFETVYELKSETPSFEEFMKTYEDGNVNYDDLNGGSLGEEKGYGPCCYKKPHCKCDCPRNDCNCEEGERYVKVYMSCPADGCESRSRSNWVHTDDRYYIWISNRANIRCEKSYCGATNKMQNWRFLCSNHSFHNGKHKEASTETWIDVVTTAGKQWGDSELVLELLMWLYKPENRF